MHSEDLAALCTTPLVLQMVWMLATGRHDEAIAPWLQFVLAAPVQFVAGARFYRAAWGALRARSANMDVLVALGTTATRLPGPCRGRSRRSVSSQLRV